MSRRKTWLYSKVILFMFALTILPITLSTTSAYFSDSKTIQAGVGTGTWDDSISITPVYPNLGTSRTFKTLPPIVTSIDPPSGTTGKAIELNIFGENLSDRLELWLQSAGIRIKPGTAKAIDAQHLMCTLDLTGAKTGIYTLYVLDNNGESTVLTDCFEVRAAEISPIPPVDKEETTTIPSATLSVSPRTGPLGSTVCITASGGPFTAGMYARLAGKQGFTSSIDCQVTPSGLQCRFNLIGIPAGTYTLQVLDKNGKVVYQGGDFNVISGGT